MEEVLFLNVVLREVLQSPLAGDEIMNFGYIWSF